VPNPLVFSAGTTTINSSHALKCTKITVVAGSATAVSMTMSDLNGDIMGVPIYVPATAALEVTGDYTTAPLIIPGGTSLSVTNAIITVTGAGGTAYVYHR
jgi:hypothetical protein